MAASANLTWQPVLGAVSYKVEYKKSSDPTWTLFNGAIGTTSTTIPNLDEGTAYDFRVTTNCNTGGSGGIVWSGNTPCKDVTSLTANFTGTTANLSWAKKSTAVSYVIEYKLQSNPTYSTASGSPLTNTGQPDPVLFNITGLTPGEAYDFRVKVNCLEGTSDGTVTSATSACANTGGFDVSFV